MTIIGFTEVLTPTDMKSEYCRMIGVLMFSKPALGQMYHAAINGSGRTRPMARQIGTM